MEAKQRTQVDISLNALTGSEMSAGETIFEYPNCHSLTCECIRM